jgi:hypothetical protein
MAQRIEKQHRNGYHAFLPDDLLEPAGGDEKEHTT